MIKPLTAAALFTSCVISQGVVLAQTSLPTKVVKARTIDLVVPINWKEKKPETEKRIAQLVIPGKPTEAELIVFYFGGPTGGIKRNVDRWVGQFYQDGMKLQLSRGESQQGRYLLVDTEGTWMRPDGTSFAQQTVTTPDSRVINIILQQGEGPETDYYFIKFSGHKDVIKQHLDTIRTAIGGSRDKETAVQRDQLK